SGGQFERLSDDAGGYLARQLARHIALSPATPQAEAAALASRAWIVARERTSGTMDGAAQDMAWILRTTTQPDQALQLIRNAALGGTLALLARTLHADAAGEAFQAAIGRGAPREATLKRVREILDQLPDGRNKAQA